MLTGRTRPRSDLASPVMACLCLALSCSYVCSVWDMVRVCDGIPEQHFISPMSTSRQCASYTAIQRDRPHAYLANNFVPVHGKLVGGNDSSSSPICIIMQLKAACNMRGARLELFTATIYDSVKPSDSVLFREHQHQRASERSTSDHMHPLPRAELDARSGVPADVRDDHGNTILLVACQNGHKRALKAALRRGADINAKNARGNTALHFCYAFGRLPSVLSDWVI